MLRRAAMASMTRLHTASPSESVRAIMARMWCSAFSSALFPCRDNNHAAKRQMSISSMALSARCEKRPPSDPERRANVLGGSTPSLVTVQQLCVRSVVGLS